MFKKYLKSILLISSLMISAASYATAMDTLFRQPNDPVAGNPNGKITVVEFFDYQCSHCVSMVHAMDAVIKANPNVRVVYKEFPIRGKMSLFAAQAALAANKQGKYSDFSHGLMRVRQPLNEAIIFNVAKNAGLDVARLKRDMKDKSVIAQLKQNYAIAQRLHLTGTPSFFVGKTDAQSEHRVNFVLGEMSARELQATIAKVSKQ